MEQIAADDQQAPGITSRDEAATQYVLFMAGGTIFALGLADVLEVIEPERWVRIPHAAPWAEGLLYHHGEPLVVANAGALLDEGRSPRGTSAAVLRIRVPEMKIGILVDRVLGTWRSAVPAVLSMDVAFVKGVWERKGGVVNLVDFEMLADRASRVFGS